jgi:hypothetical protein
VILPILVYFVPCQSLSVRNILETNSENEKREFFSRVLQFYECSVGMCERSMFIPIHSKNCDTTIGTIIIVRK